eukprot:9465970-Pyramimonas_sp.AAC.1
MASARAPTGPPSSQIDLRALGLSWACPGPPWSPLGTLLNPPGALWEQFWAPLGTPTGPHEGLCR